MVEKTPIEYEYYDEEDDQQADQLQQEEQQPKVIPKVDYKEWINCPLKQLKNQIDKANEENKHIIILDQTNQVPLYFQVAGKLLDIYKLKLSMHIGDNPTQQDIFDLLRDGLIKSMRFGKQFCLNLSKSTSFDFHKEWNHPDKFPTDLIFQPDIWKDPKTEVWRPLLKEDENFDQFKLNEGTFRCEPDFSIVFVTDTIDDDLAQVLEGIPYHREHFVKLIVQKNPNASAQASELKVEKYDNIMNMLDRGQPCYQKKL